jgi:hypothetical protein
MGLTPILLIGPFIAVVGLVSVFFVMRHKAVQTKSMYSSRRAAIERKVKAARQRTLAPVKHGEADAAAAGGTAAAPPPASYAPAAFEGPPVAPPSYNPAAAPAEPAIEAPPSEGPQPWDIGPTAPPPPPPVPIITPVEPPPEPVWTPTAPEPSRPMVETPAGAGASWAIVGEVKEETKLESGKKKKKKKGGAEGSSGWQLASGEEPGTFYEEDEVKHPSAAMAIAQYAVLVVGLVMVLIGVLVMVANSQVT